MLTANPGTIFANYTELQPRVPATVWHSLRILSIATALSVAVLTFVAPSVGLLLFWGLFIPLAPLIFFLVPGFWRNVCPMAALNQLPRLFGFSRSLTPPWLMKYNYVIGITLLLLIIPARKALFNQSGPATGVLILSALGLAFVGGLLLKGKSGWCSSICPLLPVQRLYGQTPFVVVRNSHCKPCVGCAKNCYDFNPTSAYLADQYADDPQYTAYRRFFAAAFPGVIFAFFTLPDPPTISLVALYLQFGLTILVSVGSFFALEAFGKLTPIKLPTLYAALALNLYYWFTLPPLVDRMAGLAGSSASPTLVWVGRLVLFGLTAFWLVRTYWREALIVTQNTLTIPLWVGDAFDCRGSDSRAEQSTRSDLCTR
jgi:nitrite reductase (NADH) large subunit